MALSDHDALAALRAWRAWHELKGTDPAGLPGDEDLERVVNAKPRSEADVARVRPDRRAVREFVHRHADEVLQALGERPRDAAAGDASAAPAQPGTPAGRPGPAAQDRLPAPARPAPDAPAPSRPAPAASAGSSAGPSMGPPEQADPDTLAALVFAGFAYDDQVGEIHELRPVAAPHGQQVSLTWPPRPSAQTVVYRVVFDDSRPPFSPDDCDLLAVTQGTSAVDDHPKTSALRHYAVWAHEGSTAAAAAAAQPVLHARGPAVLGVANPSVRADGPVVLGTWRALEGTARVDVLRIPAARAATAQYDPDAYGVCLASTNLTGFRDADAAPGETYVYRVYAVARDADGEQRLSRPFVASVELLTPLQAVADLQVVSDPGDQAVTLTWTPPPLGRVDLFRTRRGPAPGAEDDTGLHEENLPRAGLPDDALLRYPQEAVGDGRAVMRDVNWPDGWARGTFTPVTVQRGRVLVGRSVTRVHPQPVTEPELVERVGWQHVTFGWPPEATLVKIYTTPRGASLPAEPGRPLAQVDRQTYDEAGGLRLEGQSALPTVENVFLDVHLVGAMFHEGRAFTSAPVRVPYRGLVVLRYRLPRPPAAPPGAGEVEVTGTAPMPRTPTLRLIYNARRLPLSWDDGVQIWSSAAAAPALDPARWTPAGRWAAPGDGLVRLFVDTPASFPFGLALLDPPVEQLVVTGVPPAPDGPR